MNLIPDARAGGPRPYRGRAYAVSQGEVMVLADSWRKVQRPHGLFSTDALLMTVKACQMYRLYLRRSGFRSIAALTLEAVKLNGGEATLEEIEALPMCGMTIEDVLREVMK